MERTHPRLSVAIIFKNEIRCIERCLKSLVPLRELVSCEIRMADTGSDDGSRQIAERYADEVIDFPWIDDFSAARNAVLQRCTGDWWLSVDCDEWLDGGDYSELVDFLERDGGGDDCATVNIRNYHQDLGSNFTDFAALRLVRKSAGPYFEGKIHEHIELKHGEKFGPFLSKTLFHHDGYINFNGDEGAEKRARNMALLRKELKANPKDIHAYVQLLESSFREPDYGKLIRNGIRLVKERVEHWERYGPYVLRYAVRYAMNENLPELKTWSQLAKRVFPESYTTRMDVNFFLISDAEPKGDDDTVLSCGEEWLAAFRDGQDDMRKVQEIVDGTVLSDNPICEAYIRCAVGAVYIRKNDCARAISVLSDIDFQSLDEPTTHKLLLTLADLKKQSPAADLSALIVPFWKGVCHVGLSAEVTEKRKSAFLERGFLLFKAAGEEEDQLRLIQLFLPLREDCPLGWTAEVLRETEPFRLTELLERRGELTELHPVAWFHALRSGADFPLPDKPMPVEVFERLAVGMADCGKDVSELLLALTEQDFASDWQNLSWAAVLGQTSVRSYAWAEGGERGLKIARAFSAVENNYLSRCFTADALRDLRVLPSAHRTGVFCGRFFAQLDSGDLLGAVQTLRHASELCPGWSAMLKFLLQTVETRQKRASAPPELLALAEQVRRILSAYPPDDPAVRELKNSDVYQKVAYLIED